MPKLDPTNAIQLQCYRCGKIFQKSKKKCSKEQLNGVEKIYCPGCKIKLTMLEKYGVENPSQRKEQKESVSIKNRLNAQTRAKKMKQTCFERYGKNWTFERLPEEKKEQILQNRKLKEKQKQELELTKKDRETERIQKIRQTCLERYGVPTFLQVEYIKKLANKNAHTEEAKQKAQQTCLERYGSKNPFGSKIIQEKIKQTCLERYGVENYNQTLKGRHKKGSIAIKFKDDYFDSNAELFYYLFCIEKGLNIEHEPCCFSYMMNNQVHKYFPDFLVNDEYIEIKGNHMINENMELIDTYNNKKILYEKTKCLKDNNVKIILSNDIYKKYLPSYKFMEDLYNENQISKKTWELYKRNKK